MRVGRLLLREKLGAPVVTLLFFLACVAATIPVYLDPQLYLVLGADAPIKHWWHPWVTPFVHGGGWPGTIPHLVINSTILLIFGGLIERVLGSMRFLILSIGPFLVFVVLMSVTDYEGNGFSMVTWAYWIVIIPVLYRSFRSEGWRALADPITVISVPVLLFLIAGTIKWTHTVPFVMAIPFAIAWRKRTRSRLEDLEAGGVDTCETRTQRYVAILLAGSLFAFQVFMASAGHLDKLEFTASCSEEERSVLSECAPADCQGESGSALERCLVASCPDVDERLTHQCLICLNAQFGNVESTNFGHLLECGPRQ